MLFPDHAGSKGGRKARGINKGYWVITLSISPKAGSGQVLSVCFAAYATYYRAIQYWVFVKFWQSVQFTSLLQPNIIMEGCDIEDFLSLLVGTHPNMSFMASHYGSTIREYREIYWSDQISMKGSN
jgi:hypothetical protein